MRATTRQGRADSFAEARTFWLILALALPAMLLPLVVRAIDANGDNLDDAWEAQYGITTNVFDPAHLVGWWQMDGGTNVVDRSANHIDGTIDGAATNAFAPGLFSNALNVVPPLTVVFPPRPELVTPNGFTFSAWFKAADDTTNAATIASWSDNRGAGWKLGVSSSGQAQFQFSGPAPTAVPATDPIPLYDAGWHHIAATWNPAGFVGTPGGLATLYVDGEKQGDVLVASWSPGQTPSFSLAGGNASYLLDETRLYNRALTAKEISELPVTYTDLNGDGVSVFDAAQRHLNPYAPFPGVSPHAPQLAATNAAPQDAGLKWTPWLSNPELDKFLSQFDSVPPGHHPNYWDKGHWITAVEGRWANNRIEYRIAYGPVPPHSHFGWYWWINQGEETFQKRAANYAAHGFTLEHSNFFTRPTGEKRYQGVWHWYLPPGATDPASKTALQNALEENKPQKL